MPIRSESNTKLQFNTLIRELRQYKGFQLFNIGITRQAKNEKKKKKFAKKMQFQRVKTQ